MAIEAIKKKYPILDESGQPSTYPTYASQVFFDDGSVLEGKEFGSGGADPLAIYPVGSIYMSANETSPASLFGGTWEQLKDCFLLGAGDSYAAGSTGGEATHTLTVDEMPSHQHKVTDSSSNESGTAWAGAAGTSTMKTQYTSYTGGDQPHNNMPPYLAVYMWKRVS